MLAMSSMLRGGRVKFWVCVAMRRASSIDIDLAGCFAGVAVRFCCAEAGISAAAAQIATVDTPATR